MPKMNKVVSGALDSIRRVIQHHEQCKFVIHFWMPFFNIAMGGFRFPQIPDDYIPSGVLIPLVDITQRHIDSFAHPTTGKLTVFESPFTQTIVQSYLDLQRRYGRYGLTMVEPLSCTLGEAEETIEAFDLMYSEFNGYLQDLADFFRIQSPVAHQLDNPIKRCKVTYDQALDNLLASGRISEVMYQRLMAAVHDFQRSVEFAHRTALSPQDGILPNSIKYVNAGTKKDGLDEADLWIARQFPDFKVSSRLQGKEDTNSIDKLVEVLADRLVGTPKAAVVNPSAAPTDLWALLTNATPEEKAALRAILGIDTQPLGTPAAVPATSSVDTQEPEAVDYEDAYDPPAFTQQCSGTTRNDTRCKLDARQGHMTCTAHADQEESILAAMRGLAEQASA